MKYDQYSFEVLGAPAPKGSGRAFYRPGMKHAVMAPSGSDANRTKLKNWTAAVREAAAELVGEVEAPPFVKISLAVDIVFRMGRTSGHWGSGKNAGRLKPNAPLYPCGKPDIDKLARTTLDALTGIVFDDDSRIAKLTLTKIFAAPGLEGAMIRITALDQDGAGEGDSAMSQESAIVEGR